MSLDTITPLIIEYRYWIVIPLAFLEGPFVAFIAGTLAAADYFDPWILMIIFILRDALVDLGYYGAGVYANRTEFVHKLLHRIGVTPEHLGKAQGLWHTHPWKTIVMGKISYGIAPAFFVVAGMIRMHLPTFIVFNLIAASVLYGIFMVAGYFFGNAFGGSLGEILNNLHIALGVLLTGVAAFYIIRFYFRRRLLEAEKMAPDEN
jgi:membrane protein DedA with SNARE-associated domain